MAMNSLLVPNQFGLEMLYAGSMCWVFADFLSWYCGYLGMVSFLLSF